MADNHAVSARLTSRSHLTLFTVAAFVTSLSGGFATGVSIVPDAWAAGGLMMAAPLVVAIVVTLGLASAWHCLLNYAAHARALHERSIAFGFGLALVLIGIGQSAWLLVSLIGGKPALQSYQLAYVERLHDQATVVAGNIKVDGKLVAALDTAGSNLGKVAEAEAKQGLLSRKIGRSVVYATLNNAADGMAAKSAALAKQQESREEALTRVQEAIEEAGRAVGENDRAAFEEAASKAVTELRGAAANRLGVNDLGIGMVTDYARAPIERAINDVAAVMHDVNAGQKRVEIPFYRPIDARTAVAINPQPLPWIVAIVIETLPLIFLGLLLTVWRDEEPPSAEIRPFGRKQPFVAAAE